MFKFKRDVFDSVIGLIGFIITIMPFFSKFFIEGSFINYLLYFNMGLGLLILILLYWKQTQSVKIQKLSSSELSKMVLETSKELNNVLIYNPDKNFGWTDELNSDLIENASVKVSYIGDPGNLLTIFDNYSKEHLARKTDSNFVLPFGQESMYIILTNDVMSKIVVALIDKNDNYLISTKNKETIEMMNSFLKKDNFYKNCIDMDNISQPTKFLEVINHEKGRYLNNFKSIKTGHISYYGTEVLNTQSGWLESGNFSEINTLDLTGNPALLLTRKRYNKANEDFIRKGGNIRRVYMISKERLKDMDFVNSLLDLIEYQSQTGIHLGLQYIEDLTAEQRQDFILYDEFSVLIEESQANNDYSFGKSTAYFHPEKIKEFKRIFWNVWDGSNMHYNAPMNLKMFVNEYSQLKKETTLTAETSN